MKLNVYAIRDQAVGAFNTPIFLRSHGEAIRSFADGVNNPGKDNLLNQHPEHYTLYWLGEYDDQYGSFDCPKEPQVLSSGINVKIE